VRGQRFARGTICFVRIVALLTLAPLLLACRDATQITVVVTTDLDCKDHGGTDIVVGSLGSLPAVPTTSSNQCDANKSVGNLVIIPAGAHDSEIAFQVTTGVGINPETCNDPKNASQCIVARRALRFIPHQNLTVKVAMHASCEGKSCAADETCRDGACVSARLDPLVCQGSGCDQSALNGGDAGVPPKPQITLSLGMNHSCALKADQTVWCWGLNDVGQLGLGVVGTPNNPITQPTQVPKLTGVTSISAFSEAHTCALISDGTLRCWGGSCCGQLGDPAADTNPKPSPIVVPNLTNLRAVAVGFQHTCALGNGVGSLSCWGYYANRTNVAPPTTIPGPNGIIDTLGVGYTFAVIKQQDGTLRVVGENSTGQLGQGALNTNTTSAILVPGVSQVKEVAAGNGFVIAALNNGSVLVWGDSASAQLSLPGNSPVLTPTPAPALTGFHGFALGDDHSCALDAQGQVWCWGLGDHGQLGPASTSSATPVKVGLTAVKLVAGFSHTCALTAANEVFCWGANLNGQLGDGTRTDRPTPVKLSL
jgi:alpha-tubulin suppressor-like RCC1 family protein